MLVGSESAGCTRLMHQESLASDSDCHLGKILFAYFLIRCRAFGRETGVKAVDSLSATSLAKRSSRKCAVFDTIASYSRSCSDLKLASRFFDCVNSASAFRRAEDMGAEILLIHAVPVLLPRRFSG